MKRSISLSLLGAIMIAVMGTGCGPGQIPEPAIPSTAVPANSVVPAPERRDVPTNSVVPAPEGRDIPVYKSSFEEITDPFASGITSSNNAVRLNSENVAYQSGKQSLEAYGMLAAPQFSNLTIEFSISKLTGTETVDLSNKTIDFSYFIPAGSPIDSISILAMAGTKAVTLATYGGATTGAWNGEQGIWHYEQIDVKRIYENSAWTWTNSSNNEAREVIQNCQAILMSGMRASDGTSVQTSFFIDDFKWIGIEDFTHIPKDDSVASIRDYADWNGMRIASVLLREENNDWARDPWYLYTLAQEFNMTTVGSPNPAAKPADVAAVTLDYTFGDQNLAFAEGNGMLLRGGTGGNHAMNPKWLDDASYDELKAYLGRKIEQDITHYDRKVLEWGVFNELVDDDGASFRNRQKKNPADPEANAFAPYGWHYSPWVDGNDTSLIEYAFVKAKEVDPNAKYYLNEFASEEIGNKKAEFLYNFVVGMKNRGIPIDGVGFELHLIYPSRSWSGDADLEDLDAYLARVDQNIKRYAAEGLFVWITEFECQIRLDDVDLATQVGRDEYARRVQRQAEIYAGVVKLAKENPNVFSITFWSVADKPARSAYDGSWDHFTYPDSFLFDKNYDPKPAYFAVLDILEP